MSDRDNLHIQAAIEKMALKAPINENNSVPSNTPEQSPHRHQGRRINDSRPYSQEEMAYSYSPWDRQQLTISDLLKAAEQDYTYNSSPAGATTLTAEGSSSGLKTFAATAAVVEPASVMDRPRIHQMNALPPPLQQHNRFHHNQHHHALLHHRPSSGSSSVSTTCSTPALYTHILSDDSTIPKFETKFPEPKPIHEFFADDGFPSSSPQSFNTNNMSGIINNTNHNSPMNFTVNTSATSGPSSSSDSSSSQSIKSSSKVLPTNHAIIMNIDNKDTNTGDIKEEKLDASATSPPKLPSLEFKAAKDFEKLGSPIRLPPIPKDGYNLRERKRIDYNEQEQDGSVLSSSSDETPYDRRRSLKRSHSPYNNDKPFSGSNSKHKRRSLRQSKQTQPEPPSSSSSSSSTSSTSKKTKKSNASNTSIPASSKAVASVSKTKKSKALVQPRSKNGCWTCRIRKKKCTEEKPECSQCLNLGLECDGYSGIKPDFMVDIQSQRKKLEDIKKHTSTRKKIGGVQKKR